MYRFLKKNSDNRIQYYDIAKGLAMLCIIAGHMEIGWIRRFVFTFHVPIFFLISGYFLKIDHSSKFIKKKAKQLLLPYLITVFAIITIEISKKTLKLILFGETINIGAIFRKWLTAAIYGSGAITYSFGYHFPIIGAIWFLLALFTALIIVNYLAHKGIIGGCFIFLLSFISIISSRYFWLPFSIQAGAGAAFYVYIGWILKQYKIKIVPINRKIMICNTLLWILGIYFSYKNLNMSLVSCQFPNGLIDIVASLAASVVIINISYYIEKSMQGIAAFLAFFGRNSLIIMCAHLVEMTTLPWRFVFLSKPFVENIIIYVCKICWCSLCVFAIKLLQAFIRNIKFSSGGVRREWIINNRNYMLQEIYYEQF